MFPYEDSKNLSVRTPRKEMTLASLANISPTLVIMPPPSETREVYCFPRRQLIFSFDRRVIYHLKGLREYIPKLIPPVCPSVCTMIFKRIAGLSFILNVSCYISMASSQRGLQINRKLFLKFQIHFLFFLSKSRKLFRNFVRKTKNIQKNSEA